MQLLHRFCTFINIYIFTWQIFALSLHKVDWFLCSSVELLHNLNVCIHMLYSFYSVVFVFTGFPPLYGHYFYDHASFPVSSLIWLTCSILYICHTDAYSDVLHCRATCFAQVNNLNTLSCANFSYNSVQQEFWSSPC